MRAKFLALASATGLGLLALTGFQSTAQAHEGYRYSYFHSEHRDRDYNRGHRDHDRGDRYRDHDGVVTLSSFTAETQLLAYVRHSCFQCLSHSDERQNRPNFV